MNTFLSTLKHKIEQSVYNEYGLDNFDILRFGEFPLIKKQSFQKRVNNSIKRFIGHKTSIIAEKYIKQIEYKDELSFFWSILDKNGQDLLVELIAYRLLGYRKVKLSRNNTDYHKAIQIAEKLKDPNNSLDPGFMHFILNRMDLNPIGKNIKFYFTPLGIAIDYILEQYSYKHNNKTLIEVESGDTVLDIGGCWGDTALYFADKAGDNGKIYSFEFIPNNIILFKKNIALNPHLQTRINLIENPVSDISETNIYYKDQGPGSQVRTEPFSDQTGSATTISIDDFVEQNSINKIDFIKMDIEGAEPAALKGGINTIRKFRPKLAIAIYHSMSDFVHIPKWIHELNLDYTLHLAHYTIHSEETVIFASPKV